MAASGVQKPEAKIDAAEMVFVGYGIEAPEYQWDDYKDADLKGKVLLMMNNDPEGTPAEPTSSRARRGSGTAVGTTST